MGVKKSTVWTRACVAEILYTPASSALSKPTRTFGSCCRANFPSTVSSAAGLSLDAQPAAFTDSVRRNGLASAMKALYRVAKFSGFSTTEIRSHGGIGRQANPSQEFLRVCVSPWREEGSLLHCDIGDLHVGILMVPLRGDAFKRESKRFAQTGRQGRDAEVHGFGIGAGGFQHLHRNDFPLGKLPEVVFEIDLDNHMHNGFVT